MKFLTYFTEIFICAEAAVNFAEISCIISMIVGFKDRIENDRSDAEISEIFRPVPDL